MNSKYLLSTLVFIFIINLSFSQDDNYRIVFPKTEAERNKACNNCFKVFSQKPKEVKFSIINENGSLYFETNDKKWFNQIFKNSTDGLALDVVAKDIYSCDITSIENSQINGILIKPVYAQRLKSGLLANGNNRFRVLVGKIPSELKGMELEYNILFLGNKTLCRYQVIYNLKAYKWDLLDMGMYLDSVSFKNQKLVSNGEDNVKIRYKTLKFKIPFEKNKAVYSPEDIKPVYDSLNLTDFNIKTINIKAYASVEGSLERNIELQEGRANSIAKAIQTYQKPTIKTTISSSENWVEFLNDIEDTKYENLKTLSKTQIKKKLIGAFSSEMEVYLKNHRKALITLELEKKDKYKTMPANQLVSLFNKSIKENQLDEANSIQNSLFEKMKNSEVSPDLLQQLEVPMQLNLINFLNKNSAIKYQLNERQIVIVRNELEALKNLDPKNPKIRYNLTAIKFKIWRYNIEKINPALFKDEIYNLEKYNISKSLINRMLINYHIIQSENFNRQRDYANKDKSVNYIKLLYEKVPLTDFDYFSLAQFLSYYANVEAAADLLSDKARQIEVDEDLLFYYLNLTLINKELTKTDEYRTIMLNAVNLNKERYCQLFAAAENDGVTFQLLKDDYLRANYCENCNN
ncbi:hypothetical protein BTO05_10045 [Winogradskyella sp. PC-19]|uniref:hypothetical protein n=1 Tax=unclassified Winogradskyella TaxID=2615021 RepID=UPI000B3CBED8|nr:MULTISPECIES: hypothetical protein [unclassified Winogradskyella]ARV09959.1 hypothetical protein BTO05_10045 [Winogradskyella sp. PC-19]RZN84368.1 MAG: hypothetical protein EVB12_00330 [Winogradskyella sp.]